MNMQHIKEKVNSDEYVFLRKDPHLGENILILTTAGSIAYGTNVDTSDIDIRGVTLETKQDIMGLLSFEQFEDRATDTVIYGLTKFITLCLNSILGQMDHLKKTYKNFTGSELSLKREQNQKLICKVHFHDQRFIICSSW